jgi:F-type H+-transporting ATPase subunit delta
MAEEDRVSAYATALFEVARAEGSLERVEAELYQVARAIESNDELRSKLTDQALPVELRQGIVEDLLEGRAQPVTTFLVSFVVGAGRARPHGGGVGHPGEGDDAREGQDEGQDDVAYAHRSPPSPR